MNQRCQRCVENLKSGLRGPQAEIDIIVDDIVALIKAADEIEMGSAHEHACTRYRADLPFHQGQPEVAGIILTGETERVAADTPRGQEHACMLHGPVRIKQARADYSNLLIVCMLDQDVQPARILRLDVVISRNSR